MAFTGRTPESLIPRSDSRNPATTCKGITKSGRPCRRPIDAKASNDGVLAVVSVAGDSDSEDISAAAYFCWQHKDQAEQLAATKGNGPDTHLYPLKERNSIDTLAQRLGVLEVDDNVQELRIKAREGRQKASASAHQPPRRIHRPPTWDHVEGPFISVPSDLLARQKKSHDRHPPKPPAKKKLGFWESLCCHVADKEDIENVKHKRRTSHHPDGKSTAPSHQPNGVEIDTHNTQDQSLSVNSASKLTSGFPQMPIRESPSADKGCNSDTAKLLQYIPHNVSPQLASSLLAELSKPISVHDNEGYIYIFWLTPESSGPAPSSTASILLSTPSRISQGRRTSDVLRQYSTKQASRSKNHTTRQGPGIDATTGSDETNRRTILLKIGRANNVHRRMNEWTRQCGYSLSLVRFYPYVSSTTPIPSPPTTSASPHHQSYPTVNNGHKAPDTEGVRKVPTVMRVERMIHLELGEQRVMKKCDACGKQHQEWFEVEATENGIRKVDNTIKRWVDWAEQANQDRAKQNNSLQ